MTDSCEGANCGRNDCSCKLETPNISEESHSPLNSNEGGSSGAKWIVVPNFSDRVIGKDGSYYDCDVCHEFGELLCCDTCPSTFHLQCLDPPMESVPIGIWQCQKCWPRDDSSASTSKSPKSDSFSRVKHSTSSSSRSSDKKQSNETSSVPVDPQSRSIAVNQKLPAASLHPLDKLVESGEVLRKSSEADAHSENLEKSANHLHGEEGTRSQPKMGGLKVYLRCTTKRKVGMEKGVNLGTSSDAKSDKGTKDHDKKPAHNPVEIDGSPVEEQVEAVVACQDFNLRPYSGSPDAILREKLLIPRDVSLASADGHFFSQNDESSDSLPEPYLTNEEAKVRKERLAYLRARQKARIALRVKKVGGSAPGSKPSRNGPVQFHGQNFNGFSGLLNNTSGVVPIAATPLRMLRPEDAGNEGNNHKNSSDNISVNSNQKWSNHNQEGFGNLFPGFPAKKAPMPECSTAAGVKRQKTGISEFRSPLLGTLPVPPPRNLFRKSLNSNFFSGFPIPNTGYDNSKTMGVDEDWTNTELDSLWIGVRRYGQGNWLPMLADHNLSFFWGKTAKDLANRWEKEKARYFGPQVAATDIPSPGKRKMKDFDLNVEPSLECQMSSEFSGKEKSDEPKLLVGFHIEIPEIQPVPEAVGVGANPMQMQEAGAMAGGNGANPMPEVVEISSDSDVNSDSEATVTN